VADLRERIVAGELVPGVQLPTWARLEEQFNVGRTTLTRAMGTLKREGFVFADATRGTFVSPRPPHLHRYALAFRGAPESGDWNPFWWGLANESVAINERGETRLEAFYNVRGGEATPAHQKLITQVEQHRFAGVIFVGFPPEISKPLLDHPWLAKVAICSNPVDDQLPHVYPDRTAFVQRSLKKLAELGRKQVIVVTEGHPAFDLYDEALAEHGLQAGPNFRVAANERDPQSANRIVQLLLNQTGQPRPDALIVTNDQLVDSALAGVMAAGLRVPDDLTLIAHTNWPSDRSVGSPLIRLGFDARQVLHAALREAEQQRHGEPQTPTTAIAPIFDTELKTFDPAKASPSLTTVNPSLA
jgi:hypothetical protein